jgi:hypothetical protein
MYAPTLITVFTSIFALATAAPASVVARQPASVDVLVQSSPFSSSNLNAHAIQVILNEVKVCLGDNGFPPCELFKLSISPFGNTTDITKVHCQGFSDTKGQTPIGSPFTSAYPAVLSYTNAPVAVGSVMCYPFLY